MVRGAHYCTPLGRRYGNQLDLAGNNGMSRLAKKPIIINPEVAIVHEGVRLLCKGPKGERELGILPFVEVQVRGDTISVKSIEGHTQARANAGTMWSIIKNTIDGLTLGFSKTLEIEGVG